MEDKVPVILYVVQDYIHLGIKVGEESSLLAVLTVDPVPEAVSTEYLIHQDTHIRIHPPVAVDEYAARRREHSSHLLYPGPVPLHRFLGRSQVIRIIVEYLSRVIEDITVDKIYRIRLQTLQKLQVILVIDADIVL